ncbi:DUF1496 domain-containing protein [Shewanella sp.]|uniref:DUF1496 domain-containing protein n=1 Tax=Shewanella sp. TaxID=50422 RepID=UPI0035679791
MKTLAIGLLAFTFMSSAEELPATHTDGDIVKTVDETKYCYYAAKEYSPGSRLKQVDTAKVCHKSKDSHKLIWVDVSN